MILIIDRSRNSESYASDMFSYMGVLSRTIPHSEVFSEISNKYRAVLMLAPEEISDLADFIKRLHSYNASLPIFALTSESGTDRKLFAQIFPLGTSAASIMAQILAYTEKNVLLQPGDYRLAGLDLSCDLATPLYFDTPLPLTRTKAMIIKYLIRSYPNPTTAEEILKYSHKESRMPEISIIRTHISFINKKFREMTGRNLVEASFGKGYRILTPELAEATV